MVHVLVPVDVNVNLDGKESLVLAQPQKRHVRDRTAKKYVQEEEHANVVNYRTYLRKSG
jgi:hypothetical protein